MTCDCGRCGRAQRFASQGKDEFATHSGIFGGGRTWMRHAASSLLLGSVLLLSPLSPVRGADVKGTNTPESIRPNRANRSAQHIATDRTGALPTRDGLTLRLNTDLGSVRILSLEPGAPLAVRYTVHIETDARSPLAEHLLDRYALVGARRCRRRGDQRDAAAATRALLRERRAVLGAI